MLSINIEQMIQLMMAISAIYSMKLLFADGFRLRGIL